VANARATIADQPDLHCDNYVIEVHNWRDNASSLLISLRDGWWDQARERLERQYRCGAGLAA
jgi:hypothetical protein